MDKVIVDIHVDEDGDVTLDVPSGLKIVPGNYTTELPAVALNAKENALWTEEELKAALESHPVPANQMTAGGWEHLGIEDSAEWVEKLRRQEEERSAWPRHS